MNAIVWPEGYVPGFTDNFVSNEVIVAGLGAADVWPLLSNAPLWPTYYTNSANIRFHDGRGPELEQGTRFYFETFGFPVEAQVVEYVPPADGQPGRVAWHGWAGEEGSEERLDVHHAWLVEDLASLIHDARFRARSGHLLRLAVLRGRPASLAFVSPHSD